MPLTNKQLLLGGGILLLAYYWWVMEQKKKKQNFAPTDPHLYFPPASVSYPQNEYPSPIEDDHVVNTELSNHVRANNIARAFPVNANKRVYADRSLSEMMGFVNIGIPNPKNDSRSISSKHEAMVKTAHYYMNK